MKARKKAGVGASASAKGVLRVTESGNGKQMSVVVDVGQHPTRIRRFDGDDLGCGDAAWFAASTDAVPAFKKFLLREDTGASSRLDRVPSDNRTRSYICLRQNRWTGLRFAVIMSRLANGQLRAMSFHPRRLPKQQRDRSRSSSSAGDEELVKRAVLFARSAAFCQWREQRHQQQAMEGMPSSQQHELDAERGLKHPSALVGFDKGDKVDCRCGKNRSRGQMVTCEVCSTREHLECLDSSSQIAADYICSACLRAQKEEVFVISMDEQEEGRVLLNSGDSWTNTPKARDTGDESVCSLCGCEDNEDFETMIQPCTCDNAAVSAHPSCVTLALEVLTQKDRSKQPHTCHACGSAKPPASKRSSKRAPATDTSSTKCVKRLRSALAHPGKTEADEGVHTGKSHEAQEKADVEARKPEASLLGGRFSNAASTVPIKKRRIQIMDSVRSPSPPSRSPSPSIKVNRDEFSGSRYGKLESDKVVDERLPKCTQNKVEEEEEPGLHDYDLVKDEDYERMDNFRRDIDGDEDGGMRKDVDSGDSHGKRSHWDLNKGMDAWERPCEDGPDYCIDAGAEKSQEIVSGNITEHATSDTDEAATKDRTTEELCATSMQSTEEKNEADNARDEGQAQGDTADYQASPEQEQEPDSFPSPAKGSSDQTQAEAVEDINGDTKDDDPKTFEDSGVKRTGEAEDKEVFQEDDTFEEEEEPESDKVRVEVEEAEKVEEGQITAEDWAEEACDAEHVDYDDSEEGDEPVETVDEKVARAEGDSEGEQGEIHELEAKRESDNDNKEGPSSGDYKSGEGQPTASGDEESKPEKNVGATRRVKASGWDQLPEGFDTAEEALRASKELFRRGVRPNAWTGNRLRPPAGSRVSQFESYDRFRHEDPAWSRHDHHDQRNEMYDSDRFYSRDFGRGRSRGGPSSPLVPRRAEPWMNGSVVPPGQWGPKHHLSPPARFSEGGGGFGPHGQANAAAVAAAKVESSGFVVAPDGTITKAGSPGAAVVRGGGGRPFPAAGRNPPPLILNPTRAADPEAMAPPGRGIGLSPALRVGPGMGMVGVSPGLRSSRGVFDRSYGGGHSLDSPAMRAAPDGRGGGYVGEPHPERWDHRRERSPSIRRRSRSRSRSDSPRKSLRHHSRSPPPGYASSAREMSPASSVPKLPLPPPPPRGQRSPPAGLKRLSDRRDERRFFEMEYHHHQQQQQHCLESQREPRTSGWDLGPGDVGRISSGRFDVELERNHDRRRRDRGFSSSRPGRDGEEEVAPRRRRPPS
ncbi:uncharacterized protein LOC112341258 [Selaginella moellendorffii]|uniref:uncharacterized protein LOC112341258 n=1 Tax=Selaginella moellendorffii TaxID=88036 RepID=UPI000D1C88A7|nr:uncharacterized protein LOC112341258 [Selaginella moellendorffii]|eukprot:XP_024516889.1 uncharacterized protein LOC112341258 [Selaginella moellendorffii]